MYQMQLIFERLKVTAAAGNNKTSFNSKGNECDHISTGWNYNQIFETEDSYETRKKMVLMIWIFAQIAVIVNYASEICEKIF
jgi:hypothetical protein